MVNNTRHTAAQGNHRPTGDNSMKYWLITAFLVCVTIGLGIW
jgi:hypothetical protein